MAIWPPAACEKTKPNKANFTVVDNPKLWRELWTIRQYGSDVGILLRQRKYEGASFANFGFYADTAPVLLDDLFHDRKPDAGVLDSIARRKGLE